MLDEFIEALRIAPSEPTRRLALYALEDGLTPNELRKALPRLDSISPEVSKTLDTSFCLRHLRKVVAQVYRRRQASPDIVVYEGAPNRTGRALLFVLNGRAPRPMMSNSLFVQHLPAQLFDVVIITDRSNNHYANGVPGYASSLLALGQRLMADFHGAEYARVYFYGLSSGGLAAVRLGLLMKAFRSIAIGGLFAWPIQRLKNGEVFDAFDPICACNPGHRDDVVCVHATKHRDTVAARQVVKTIGAQGLRVTVTEDHNVLHELFLKGQLGNLQGNLLGFRQRPNGTVGFVTRP